MNIGDFKAYLESGRSGANTPLPEGLPSTIRPVVRIEAGAEASTEVEGTSPLEDDGATVEVVEADGVDVTDSDSVSPIGKYLKLASFMKG